MNPENELDQAAAERWDAEGHDPDTIEDWDPNTGGYTVGEFDIPEFHSQGETGRSAGWHIDGEDADDRLLTVWYGKDRINLAIALDRGGTHTFTIAGVDPDGAREIATALWQAAEELERRPKGERHE